MILCSVTAYKTVTRTHNVWYYVQLQHTLNMYPLMFIYSIRSTCTPSCSFTAYAQHVPPHVHLQHTLNMYPLMFSYSIRSTCTPSPQTTVPLQFIFESPRTINCSDEWREFPRSAAVGVLVIVVLWLLMCSIGRSCFARHKQSVQLTNPSVWKKKPCCPLGDCLHLVASRDECRQWTGAERLGKCCKWRGDCLCICFNLPETSTIVRPTEGSYVQPQTYTDGTRDSNVEWILF